MLVRVNQHTLDMNKKMEKMQVAVQNPFCIMGNQERNFDGYNFKFVEKYCDVIYLSGIKASIKILLRIKQLKWKKKICFSVRNLNKHANVLICFNGRPYVKSNAPVSKFTGLKIYHTMDFAERISESSAIYQKAKVDYLLAYSQFDVNSAFFRKYFCSYVGKVIPVPFGYGERFKCLVEFTTRKNKCIALGSVNPINDPLMPCSSLSEYIDYYYEYQYSHLVRKEIVERINEWSDCIDSRLPIFPETKNIKYNAVEELNNYTMFINDASIDSFPPARTYEGIACGAVMVAEKIEAFEQIGFIDGFNCIMFEKGNYDEMILKIRYYMEHFDELQKIQKESLLLAERYGHDKVADRLYEEIKDLRK